MVKFIHSFAPVQIHELSSVEYSSLVQKGSPLAQDCSPLIQDFSHLSSTVVLGLIRARTVT